MRLEHKFPFARDHVVVTWCFFNVCNYSCTYCGPFFNDGTKVGVDLPTAERFVRSILRQHPEKKFFFEFTGGEITLFDGFPQLAKLLKDLGCEVALISNGSRELTYWEELAGFVDHVALSFHPESASPDHFFDVLSVLEARVTTHLFVMALQPRFEELREFAGKVQDRFPSVSVSFDTILNANMAYTQKQMFELTHQLIRDQERARTFPGQSLGLFSKPHKPYRKTMVLTGDDGATTEIDPRFDRNNSWKGWSCSAGIENILVDWDGNIFRGWCKVGGAIGNVRDESITFPEDWISCTKDLCVNSFDIAATKKKAP